MNCWHAVVAADQERGRQFVAEVLAVRHSRHVALARGKSELGPIMDQQAERGLAVPAGQGSRPLDRCPREFGHQTAQPSGVVAKTDSPDSHLLTDSERL